MSSTLWYVDRSRIEAGAGDGGCTWKRLLNYHFGPSGFGITRKSESVPLTTGSAVHVGTQLLAQWAKDHPAELALPLEVIRHAAKTAREQYELRAHKRGLEGFGEPERLDYIIGEQSALIGGLIWCAGLEFFPWLLEKYEVVEVEQEDVYVVGCTCGYGDGIGTPEEHEARDCGGLGFMARPDLLTRSRTRPDSYQYWEYKTTGRVTKAWQESWETKVQFHAGVVAVEQRLGIRVDETYVVGLYKGDRRDNREGVRQQSSVCCYGYKREAKPPHQEEGWEALFEDPGRTPQRLSWQQWKKTPIWTQEFEPGFDPVEYWIRWLTPEIRAQQLAIVGPFNRQEILIEGFFRELVPAETRWQQGIWAVYEALSTNDWEWSHPSVQAVISEHFQRSWACRKFGLEHECQFKGLCFQHEGWQDPLGSGKFVLRRPHHEPELQKAIAAGVIPPEDEYEEED